MSESDHEVSLLQETLTETERAYSAATGVTVLLEKTLEKSFVGKAKRAFKELLIAWPRNSCAFWMAA
jgi:hypothetical protein